MTGILLTCFALSTLCFICNAQDTNGVSTSSNLTVSFIPANLSYCPSSNSAATFSANILPGLRQSTCYNLGELFASNNTLNSTGLHNYTGRNNEPPWASYTLTNSETFDSSTNHSQIRYAQTRAYGDDDENAAPIALRVYGDRDCQNTRPPGTDFPTPLITYVGWSCRSSSEEGDCYAVPFEIQSFSLGDASERNDRDVCMVAAVGGEGIRERGSLGLMIVGVLAVMFLV